jgi:hypothetical protein
MPVFTGRLPTSGDALPKNLSAIEAIAVYYAKLGNQNGNPG